MKNNMMSYMEHFREVTSTMMNGVIEMIKHPDGTADIIYANEAAGELLLDNKEDITMFLNEDPYAFVYPADKARVGQAIEACAHNENVKETYRIIDKNGEVCWVLAHFHAMPAGDDLHIVIVYSNISELMNTQAALHSENSNLHDIINSIPLGLVIFEMDEEEKISVQGINDQLIVFANGIGSSLDGNYRNWSKEELTVVLNQSIYSFCMNEDAHLVRNMLNGSKQDKITTCTFRLRGSTEENVVYVRCMCYSKPASIKTRNYYVTFEDVTLDVLQEKELDRKQSMLYEMSFTDTLTSVKNRNSYNKFINVCRKKQIENAGVIFADLNGLKRINDMLGHQYGDEMIKQFSAILGHYFEQDYIFRISGDEFVCFCPSVSREEFKKKMKELLQETEQFNNIASIGYVWEESITDVKLSVNQAEQLMYVEKQRFYEIEKSLKSKHRPLILNSLLNDFENGRFKMYLQPKADLNDSKIIGAEALVRKIDDTGRVIAPYEFVPQLEKERLIPKIDFYILEEACKFLQDLKREGKNDFKLSVNMSRVTLVENDYIQTVEAIIKKYDININQLEFEITESNETMDNFRLEDYIQKIKALGISVSLDDVGSEFSSLPMLLLEGIDTVKLDRSLIVKVKTPKAAKMLEYVTEMCHDLGLTVIAEGVETEDDCEDLRRIRCDYYQGYLLSKPISTEEFTDKFLENDK